MKKINPEIDSKYESILKEYEYIREKMLRNEYEKIRIVVLSASGWLISLGLAEKGELPIFIAPAIMIFILILGTQKEIANSYNYIRCFTYIKEVIEPEIPWLHWETMIEIFNKNRDKVKSKSVFRKIIAAPIKLLSYWPVWIYLATLFFSISYISRLLSEWNIYILGVYILFLLLSHIVVIRSIILRSTYNPQNISEEWRRIRKSYLEVND